MMHVFFRGLKSSVNFLIATLKRFLDILSIFSDKHLPSFDPYSCEIDLSLFYHHYFILRRYTNGPYQP